MSVRTSQAMIAVVFVLTALMTATASAQPRESSPLRLQLLQAGAFQARHSSDGLGDGSSFAVAYAKPAVPHPLQAGAQRAGTSKRSVIGWSIAAGIAGGIAVSAVAASKYGDNETGQFCTRCFVQWSAVSIPVGAGIGAGVGYFIDRARR
jgi:hypothetical protein